jgi:CRP/FNR family transcriptional regulator, cyclic AMP receptor protein
MTDLIERTFHWLEEQLPGRVSRPGNNGYVAATTIWAKRVGRALRGSDTRDIPLLWILRDMRGMTGVVKNRRWRRVTARAASDVEVEILTPTEFIDHIAGSPRAARGLIRCLSQRLREADDRIVNDGRRSGRAHGNWEDADSQTLGSPVNSAYLAAKNPWLERQFHTPLRLGDLPFVVGRRPVEGEGLPPCQPDLKLDDAAPFMLSRNHFIIEKRDGDYHVRDLCSTLGTIVNGEPVGDYFRTDDAPLRAGDNEVIAGGVNSPFVFSVFID